MVELKLTTDIRCEAWQDLGLLTYQLLIGYVAKVLQPKVLEASCGDIKMSVFQARRGQASETSLHFSQSAAATQILTVSRGFS